MESDKQNLTTSTHQEMISLENGTVLSTSEKSKEVCGCMRKSFDEGEKANFYFQLIKIIMVCIALMLSVSSLVVVLLNINDGAQCNHKFVPYLLFIFLVGMIFSITTITCKCLTPHAFMIVFQIFYFASFIYSLQVIATSNPNIDDQLPICSLPLTIMTMVSIIVSFVFAAIAALAYFITTIFAFSCMIKNCCSNKE
jgi:hypothetical protein